MVYGPLLVSPVYLRTLKKEHIAPRIDAHDM